MRFTPFGNVGDGFRHIPDGSWLSCRTDIYHSEFIQVSDTASYLFLCSTFQTTLNSSFSYPFPPISLCPRAWLDVEKALSLGISWDGLLYGLGYITKLQPQHIIKNLTTAQKQFFEFYESQNFSSLLEFYEAISVDLTTVYSMQEYQRYENVMKLNDNDSYFLRKAFKAFAICYAYQFSPAQSSWSEIGGIVKIRDKAMGLLSDTFGWLVYTSLNIDTFNPVIPRLYLSDFTNNGVLITVSSYVSLPNSEEPCKDANKDGTRYSGTICARDCKNEHFLRILGCKFFRFDAEPTVEHPNRYCHYAILQETAFPAIDARLLTEFRFQSAEALLDATANQECLKRCPRRCKRTVHQAYLQTSVPLRNVDTENSSNIAIWFEHNSFIEGGSLTLLEIRKYSFTDLVSNVGGALGVFVGGTMMTLAQVVMFFVNYLCNRNASKG